MSLKTVELQVALPRTLEVSRIQEHQQQRTIHEQQSLIDERTLHDEHNRQRPVDVEHSEKNELRQREQNHQKQQREADGSTAHEKGAADGDEKKSFSVPMRDPMRGRYIDISL